MSTTENQPAHEPSAVVDDEGASILAGSEHGHAYSGHGDRHELAETIYAAAQIERYASITDEGWAPELELPLDTWAEQLARSTGRAVEDAAFLIAKQLCDQQIQRKNLLGAVSLDLNPEVPGRPQDLGHPSAPKVIFFEIRSGSALYDEKERRAMAVWFQPEVDNLGYAVNPRRGKNGRFYTDDTYLPGYLGICEFFSSLHRADEAMTELRRSVRLLATPATSDEEEPWRSEDADADVARRGERKRFVPRDAPAF